MSRIVARYNNLPLPAKAAAWFAVCSALQSGASFLAIPFLTRLMSTDQYGVVTLYNSWRQIIIIFATLNIYCGVFNTGMSRWKDERDRYLSSMIGLAALLVFVVSAVYFVFRGFFNNLFQLSTPFMFVMFVQIFASTVFSLWSARQRFEYRYRALLGMTFAYAFIGQAVSIISVWLTPDGSAKAFVSVVSLTTVLLLIAICLTILSLKKSPFPVVVQYWAHAVRFNLPLIPHYLATLVLGQADRIMISSINGLTEAAIYGVAYTIGLVIQILTGAIGNAIVPWLYSKLEARETSGISHLMETLVVCVGGLNALVVLVAPELMLLAGPELYSSGVYVIPPVALSMLFTFVYGLFANIEFYYEKKAGVVVASVVAAIVNIVLNLLVLPAFGFVAAGYTTLVCYALLAVAHHFYAQKALSEAGLTGVLRGKRIAICCMAPVPLMVLSVALYPFLIARVFVLAALVGLAWLKREDIVRAAKQIKRPRQ